MEPIEESAPVAALEAEPLEPKLVFPGLTAAPRLPTGAAAEAVAEAALLEEPEEEAETTSETNSDVPQAAAEVPDEPALAVEESPEPEKEYRRLPDSEAASKAMRESWAAKQGQLAIGCPNCGSTGTIPWGRLGSLLCCGKCWRWYRVATGGSLVEAPAPKKFKKGTFRSYRKDGNSRTMEVTAEEAKRKRRAWKNRRFYAAAGLHINDSIVLLMAGGYMVGLFFLCAYIFRR